MQPIHAKISVQEIDDKFVSLYFYLLIKVNLINIIVFSILN